MQITVPMQITVRPGMRARAREMTPLPYLARILLHVCFSNSSFSSGFLKMSCSYVNLAISGKSVLIRTWRENFIDYIALQPLTMLTPVPFSLVCKISSAELEAAWTNVLSCDYVSAKWPNILGILRCQVLFCINYTKNKIQNFCWFCNNVLWFKFPCTHISYKQKNIEIIRGLMTN